MELSPEEVRVLGALVEKAMATPQSYPLTLNSLRLACNQATNRQPVVDYDDDVVQAALTSLRARGLTRVVHSRSNRAPKYRHVLDEVWSLGPPELAVLSALALRGPQTLGELKARTERLHGFDALADVEAALDRLASHAPEPLATRLPRQPGQKDARYLHLLAAPSGSPGVAPSGSPGVAPSDRVAGADAPPTTTPAPAPPLPAPAPPPAPAGSTGGEAMARLQDEVAELRRQVAALRDDLSVLWELVGRAPEA